MKVAVIFGGKSTENYVSRMSAVSVVNNLDKVKYEIVMIGITEEGKWIHYIGDIDNLTEENWSIYAETDGNVKNGIERLMQDDIDIIFPVLHGPNGEDGTVQGLFELLAKPYVGCGVLASAISMDKAYTKRICRDAGINQCKYLAFERCELERNIDGCIEHIEHELGYPNFVKPANAGSSVGTNKAKDREDLKNALLTAASYDIRIVVEEFVNGREIECALLGNYDAQVAIPGEVIAANEFYDYEAKYFNEGSSTQIPAQLTNEQQEEVMGLALKIYRTLDCKGLSRIDFFLDRDTGKFIFNEVNTLPGFTNISMYSKMWAACGIPYNKLLDKLIELAFENFEGCKRKYTV